MANEIANEIELLGKCLKGSNDAFGGIVAKYQSLVCAITYSATGDVATSEDVAQEVFVNAWKNLRQLKDLSKFRAWLCSIARNVVCNYLRDKKRDIAVRGVPMDSFGDISYESSEPVDRMISREQEAVVREALGRIPEEYREPLVLFYREEQSVREVAAQLELSEEAVRTRLSRARLMLKNEVEMMIENTIGRSRPGKAFTAAVMAVMAGIAGIGVGSSGAVAAIAGTGTGIGISTGTAAGGSAIMAGLTAKILTAAAVIAVSAATYVGYKTVGTRNVQTQPITVDVNVTGSEAKDMRKEMNSTKAVSSVIETSNASMAAATAMITGAKPKMRHPNWPEANEPVKDMYSQVTQVMYGGVENTIKSWVKLPDRFREENIQETVINDGKKRLTLNLKNITGIAVNGGEKQTLNIKNKTAQLEDQWMQGDKVIWQNTQTLENHGVLIFVRYFRDPNVPAGTITEIEDESNDEVLVYQVRDRTNDANIIFTKAWVDRRSMLPEKVEATVIGDPNKAGGLRGASIVFDFSPIQDKMFSTDIPSGFDVLPEKAAKTLSGKVVDLNGRGVAGAQIWLRDWTRPQMIGPIESDAFGQFTLKMPPDREGLQFTACLWARMKNDPRWVGWTVLWSDKEPESNRFERSVGSMGHIRASEKYISSNGQQGIWCESASDIVIVMEEGAKIYGQVRDRNGKGAENAAVEVRIQELPINKPGGRINTYYLCKEDFWTAKTDSEGYYEIHDFPKLWNECFIFVVARPDQKSTLVGECRSIRRLGDMNEPLEASFDLLAKGPTIRGVVKDNYDMPLAERWVDILLKDRQLNDNSVRTDAAGKFEFKGCPAAERVTIKAGLSLLSISPHEKDKYQNFVYYPDVKTDVVVKQGKDVYDIELTTIKPEIEIEAVLTDSAGNVLPYFPVEVQADEQIYGEWQVASNLLQRTDEKGRVKFVKVPEMRGLKLIGNRNSPRSDSSQSPEMQQYFRELVTEYSKFSQAEVPVHLSVEQKHYSIQAVILTQEERNRQRDKQ